MSRPVAHIVALLGLAAGGYAFLRLAWFLQTSLKVAPEGRQALGFLILFTGIGALAGFLFLPLLARDVLRFVAWVQSRLFRAPIQDVVAGSVGLIIGLIIAYLLRPALTPLPVVGSYLPVAVSLLLGYLGWMVAVHKRDDLLGLLHLAKPGGRERAEAPGPGPLKILDTSAIIDGRIADICQAGFIDGTLVVPSFVLEELRRIADSTDVLKRNRGRRGLDILNRMQKEETVPIRIYDRDPGGPEVDAKLVRLAKALNAKIVTNDFNLNKVARLQGVQVLNLNELANAVKPAVLPGEEMTVHVLRDGKEPGQGVGYLDDGTMIVVEGGKRHLGETIGVEVTSVIQTAAGRMIFARPKAGEAARASAPRP